MGDEPKRPERRHTLEIEINGDTEKDLTSLLLDLAFSLREGGLRNITSGGPSRSAIITYTERPDQTHEVWSAELDVYVAWIRDQRAKEKEGNEG